MRSLKNIGSSLADKIAGFVGSWTFILLQSVILITWMYLNVDHLVTFDPYPFILMNLLLSAQAAYATPMILMSSNRQSLKDRAQLKKDLDVDTETNKIIKGISKALQKLDSDLELDRQALKDHLVVKEELEEIKQEVRKLNAKMNKLRSKQ